MQRATHRLTASVLGALALTAFGGQSAQAGPLYTYLGAMQIQSSSAATGKLSTNSAMLGVGYTINDFVDVEAEVVGPGSGDSFTTGGVLVSFNPDYGVAAYAKIKLPVSDTITLFARAGWAQGAATSSFTVGGVTTTTTATNTGVAYGIGGQWNLSGSSAIRLDVTGYNFTDSTASASLAYVHRW